MLTDEQYDLFFDDFANADELRISRAVDGGVILEAWSDDKLDATHRIVKNDRAEAIVEAVQNLFYGDAFDIREEL